MQNLVDLLNTNSDKQWLLAFALFVVTVGLLRLFHLLLTRKFRKLALRTTTRWDDNLIDVFAKTHWLFMVLVALYAATQPLELKDWMNDGVQIMVVIAVLVQVGIWLNALLKLIIEQHRREASVTDPAALSVISMIGFTARVALWSVVLLLVLDNLGIDITALVAGLGIGGIAVALAVQNILGDLFASLSIVLDKPFVVGDFLIIGDLMGGVEHIGLKTTRLRSLSGEQLVFSNTDLLNSRIRNYGRMLERRVVFTLGVTYQTPLEQLKRIPGLIRKAVEAQQNTRFDRSHFMKHADFSLNFETVYYVLSSDYSQYMDIQQDILLNIHEQFEVHGIEFAYPTQTLYMNAPP
jgi:small-conductance mechanosensitive channel